MKKEYPLFEFKIEKIKAHCSKLKTLTEKRNYLDYLREQYKLNHSNEECLKFEEEIRKCFDDLGSYYEINGQFHLYNPLADNYIEKYFKENFPEEWQIGQRYTSNKFLEEYKIYSGRSDENIPIENLHYFLFLFKNKFGENEAVIRLKNINKWFDYLPNHLDIQPNYLSDLLYEKYNFLEISQRREKEFKRLYIEIKNDLMFGFICIFFEQIKLDTLKNAITTREDFEVCYDKIQSAAAKIPSSYDKIKKMLEDIIKEMKKELDWSKGIKAYYKQGFSDKVERPRAKTYFSSTKNLQDFLLDLLSNHIKNRRDKEDVDKNKIAAAKLLKEVAVFFGVKLEHEDTLRRL